MKFHGQNLESLYKDVPMRLLPVEYLPDDYEGPNAGTEKELIGNDNDTFFGRHLRTCFARVTVVHSTATLSFLRIHPTTTHILYLFNKSDRGLVVSYMS